jgi:hypothetical protein
MSPTSACGGGSGRALVHVLDLFGSGSSASDGEAAAPVPCRKYPQKSPPLKAVSKPSDAPTMKVHPCGVLLFICPKAVILTFVPAGNSLL